MSENPWHCLVFIQLYKEEFERKNKKDDIPRPTVQCAFNRADWINWEVEEVEEVPRQIWYSPQSTP